MFLGYVVISFGCSYILTLMAEMPYILLIRIYTQFRGGKKDTGDDKGEREKERETDKKKNCSYAFINKNIYV